MSSQQTPDTFPPVSFDEFELVSYDRWKEEATAALNGGSFERQLFTKTYEGITLEPIYTMEHAGDATHKPELPGGPDYLRGTHAAGYIGSPWTVAQSADGVVPGQVGAVLRRELEKGSNAINIPFAASVLAGANMGEEDYAGNGMLLAILNNMKCVLRDIKTEDYELQLYAGASAAPMLAMVAGTDEAGAAGNFKGCIGADPIGLLAETGTLPCDINQLYDEMALSARWAAVRMPGVKTIFVRGDVYHNGGGNAIQEVAYCVATAVAYLDAMALRGLTVNEAAGQIRFGLALGVNFFMEIAKLRAARMVWAQVVKAYGGDETAQQMDIFARTSYFAETLYDPYVNILRTTSQAFSGVVGGTAGLQVAPFDEAIGQSDEQSRRVARNIQLMFQSEFDMLRPVDPAGGSWYIENLTQQLAEKVWALFQQVSADGGILAGLKSGDIQSAVAGILKDRRGNLATRRDRAVGVNMYANMTETPIERQRMAPADVKAKWEGAIAGNLAEVDSGKVAALLAALPGAMGGEPIDLVDRICEAFEAGATWAQVRTALNDGFTSDLAVTPIPASRWTEEYEVLRRRTEGYEARAGKTLDVFLANMGPIPQHKARADFTSGFMEVAHFKILGNDGFPNVEEAAAAAEASGAGITVICSTDATYPELVPPLAKLIKAKCPDMLILLAGAPAPEMKDAYLEAGVDDFIHVRANCLQMLTAIQDKKGV